MAFLATALDRNGNLYTLDDAGMILKRDPAGAPIWSQTYSAIVESEIVYPNTFQLDLQNRVWLLWNDKLNTQVLAASTGLVSAEVAVSPASQIAISENGTIVYLFSPSRGILHRVQTTVPQIISSLSLVPAIPGYMLPQASRGIAVSLAEQCYLGAVVSGSAELLRINGPTLAITRIPLGASTPPILASSTASGEVWVAALDGSLIHYSESQNGLVGFVSPPAMQGLPTLVTFDPSGNLYLFSDGLYTGSGQLQILSVPSGTLVDSVDDLEPGIKSGDPLGYLRTNVVGAIEPAPQITPTWNASLVYARVFEDGSVRVTGLPGAIANALTIDVAQAGPVSIGVVVPALDGSFSLVTAPGIGVLIGEPLVLTALYDLPAVLNVTTAPHVVVDYTSEFLNRSTAHVGRPYAIKVRLTNTLGAAITSGDYILHIRKDSDLKWFTGSSFVVDAGDYLPLSHIGDGVWMRTVTLPESAQVSTFIRDVFALTTLKWTGFNLDVNNAPAEQVTLTATANNVQTLVDREAATFDTPVSVLTNPSGIGTAILERLQSLNRIGRHIEAAANLLPPLRLEGIRVILDVLRVKRYDTPLLTMTITEDDLELPTDLTGARVFFRAKVSEDTPTLQFNRECEVVDAKRGQVEVRLTSEDTDMSGRYIAEVEVLLGANRITARTFTFLIDPDLG